jgi:protein-L-isoaspartate(D-aspartate) O-methyltransferase
MLTRCGRGWSATPPPCAQGAVRSEAVERTFASVRRDRCITSFHTPDGVVEVPQGTVPPAEILDRVYSDQALITHFDERGAPCSSSSQPTLMAGMLDALELAPGMRVLEVGAGTGYNAALVAALTAAPVVTVDTGERVVAEARAALRRLSLDDQVTVVHGDGSDGWSAAAPLRSDHRDLRVCRAVATVAGPAGPRRAGAGPGRPRRRAPDPGRLA